MPAETNATWWAGLSISSRLEQFKELVKQVRNRSQEYPQEDKDGNQLRAIAAVPKNFFLRETTAKQAQTQNPLNTFEEKKSLFDKLQLIKFRDSHVPWDDPLLQTSGREAKGGRESVAKN